MVIADYRFEISKGEGWESREDRGSRWVASGGGGQGQMGHCMVRNAPNAGTAWGLGQVFPSTAARGVGGGRFSGGKRVNGFARGGV